MEKTEEIIKSKNEVLHFLSIMEPYGDHPRKVNKLTNTRYLISKLQYTESVSCFQ